MIPVAVPAVTVGALVVPVAATDVALTARAEVEPVPEVPVDEDAEELPVDAPVPVDEPVEDVEDPVELADPEEPVDELVEE